MTTYLFNSPVLPGPGHYRLLGPLPEEEACNVAASGLESAVGHASTAAWLSRVLGIEVPVNRSRVDMRPGDSALVFRLRRRQREGAVLSLEELARAPQEFCILFRDA